VSGVVLSDWVFNKKHILFHVFVRRRASVREV
jgi:hypothetical protein